MDTDSKRMNAQTHRKNKDSHKRYKANSKSGNKEIQGQIKTIKPSVTTLPSNWDKYERDVDDESVAPTIDLDALLSLSSNISQFQLKEDRVFLPSNEGSSKTTDFFELDMNLISLGFSTIPFYKRLGIPEAILSENELNFMNKEASDAKEVYEAYLVKQNKPTLNEELEKKLDVHEFIANDEVEIETENLDVIEEIPSNKNDETTELEEWLDNIL